MASRRTVTLVVASAIVAGGACASPALRSLDDERTTARVLTALLNDPQLGALRLEVTTVDGTVTLGGRVTTPDEERRALDVARRIDGVIEVVSTLVVAPPGR